MKKIYVLLTFVLACIMAKADGQVLQIWQSDGNVMTIKLSEEPKTSYADGNLVIKTTKTSITFPLEKVVKFTYSKESTGISSPVEMQSDISSDGQTITFTNLKPHTSIYLYNTLGQLLRTIDCDEQSNAIVSVSHFPVGVYIVKVNSVTFKMIKR